MRASFIAFIENNDSILALFGLEFKSKSFLTINSVNISHSKHLKVIQSVFVNGFPDDL
jgi:hypothetical protein